MPIYELKEQDVQIIGRLCDIALKSGGVQNIEPVNRILGVISSPIEQDKKEKK